MSAFADLMNEKAAELGCQDSHFSNPSGLNDENHYVSAYDMALITKAAFENEDFSKIVATTYYELPPNKKNPEGQGISPGNKMIKKNWPDQYRPDVIGGKTGYTSIALNTLVIGAQQGDTKFVTVILHSSGTQYSDTKALLNFGFNNFKAVRIADYDKTFSTIGDDLKISGLPTSEKQVLTIDPDSKIILPHGSGCRKAACTHRYIVRCKCRTAHIINTIWANPRDSAAGTPISPAISGIVDRPGTAAVKLRIRIQHRDRIPRPICIGYLPACYCQFRAQRARESKACIVRICQP